MITCRTPLLAAILSSAGLFVAHPNAASAQVGFDFGINDKGAFGLRNTSTPSVSLDALTVTFTAPNLTFFDTAPTSPGLISTGFNLFYNVGVTAVTFPSEAATDGTQTATFTFTGFDSSDLAGISFDLDVYDQQDTVGVPAGGLVSALFSNGEKASGIIGSAPFTVPGLGNWDRGVRVTGADPVPEPGAYLVGSAFIGTMGLCLFRARRRLNKVPA